MGRRKKGEPPRMREHKASGRAYVGLWNADTQKEDRTYLGAWGSREANEAYTRWLAEWSRGYQAAPVSSELARPTVAAAILDFTDWAEGYYLKEGAQTSEVGCLRAARWLWGIFGRPTCTISSSVGL